MQSGEGNINLAWQFLGFYVRLLVLFCIIYLGCLQCGLLSATVAVYISVVCHAGAQLCIAPAHFAAIF